MTTETTTQDLAKLTTQANELRGAMIEALGKSDDNAARKLGNELAQVNKQILEIEVSAQGDERTAYMDAMHDALNTFELDGLTLTVKFNAEDGVSSVIYTPIASTIDAIKTSVAGITRPTSAKAWTYGRDESGHQSFDFGGTPRKTSTPSNGNGTRTVGWTTKNGADTTLGKAFDECATAEDKATLATLNGGSATNAYKVQTITKAGYTKK